MIIIYCIVDNMNWCYFRSFFWSLTSKILSSPVIDYLWYRRCCDLLFIYTYIWHIYDVGPSSTAHYIIYRHTTIIYHSISHSHVFSPSLYFFVFIVFIVCVVVVVALSFPRIAVKSLANDDHSTAAASSKHTLPTTHTHTFNNIIVYLYIVITAA